ncbi:DUF1302 domain-containing protein [Pseudomonas paeninsulae]|uniref:DUF1302 domain-containing protein n=1 Tax=Pseudomonas paeninsulae TaxID=3110772 RepID=UPI002D776357|nr:DUF1302 domain-containing protein [Pseudomonas sp. IT1137]
MKSNNSHLNLRRSLLASAVLAACMPAAQAFEIDTGSDDWAVRFDNTLKLNYAQRVESPNSKLANTFNSNDGNRNFSSGSAVSERIDVLTELDVVFKEQMGFRISANSWYDHAYGDIGAQNDSPNRIENGAPTSSGLSGYGERYYNGPSSEILDAFVFGSIEVGDGSMLSSKLGKTTSYWGETVFAVAHGIAYGQAGIDVSKQLAVPGTEAKELFIPREQLLVNFNLNEEWNFSGQYFFGWDEARLPEAGTYLGFNDGIQHGGHNLSLIAQPNPLFGASGFTPLQQVLPNTFLGADIPGAVSADYLRVYNGRTYTPDDRGDFGLSAKWAPLWLDGSLGFYYRKASDVLPNLVITPNTAQTLVATDLCGAALGGGCASGLGLTPSQINAALPDAVPLPSAALTGNAGTYNQFYADDIDIFGISLSKSLGGVSVGVDLNYRENMPLNSVAATVSPGAAALGMPGFIASFNGDSDDAVAKGKTLHLVVNGLAAFGDTALWDSSTVLGELAYSRWLSVDKNEHLFKGEDWYRGVDKVSKNNYVLGVNFTPTWYQVLPGMDMYLPLSYSVGLSGNSAVQTGGNEGAGSYSVGIAADLYAKYRFDLKYVDNFGPFDTCETGTDGAAPGAASNYACVKGQATAFNSPAAQLKDRGMVTFTFKTTF